MYYTAFLLFIILQSLKITPDVPNPVQIFFQLLFLPYLMRSCLNYLYTGGWYISSYNIH